VAYLDAGYRHVPIAEMLKDDKFLKVIRFTVLRIIIFIYVFRFSDIVKYIIYTSIWKK
jgi:hypothetical protein